MHNLNHSEYVQHTFTFLLLNNFVVMHFDVYYCVLVSGEKDEPNVTSFVLSVKKVRSSVIRDSCSILP
jgi:hypothetical protein